MEKMKRRYRRLTAAALACMLLCSGCSGEKEEPEVYIDKNEPDVVITLFTQGENISEIINKCCSDVINPKTKGNIILYSDFADFYAEEGLSYRELLLKRMESGQADDLYIIPAEDVLDARKVLSMIYPVLTVSAAFLRMPSGRVHIRGRCFLSLCPIPVLA